MKKYSSVYMRVINVNANDIIATSDPAMGAAFTEGEHIGRIGERHGFDEDFEVY